MTEEKRRLFNLKVFIRRNPGATVSDYAKDLKDGKELVKAYGLAYNASRENEPKKDTFEPLKDEFFDEWIDAIYGIEFLNPNWSPKTITFHGRV